MPKGKYQGKAAVALNVLEVTARVSNYRDVLSALSHAIKDAGERAEASVSRGDEWADAIVDGECDLIESLLGAALVVCQVQITAIVSDALHFRETIGKSFTAFSRAREVHACGPKMSCGITNVEALWALANYYKHCDEWPHDWSQLEGDRKRTADTIQKVGLRYGSTGNLRSGAEALGNDDYHRVELFADAIDEWAQDVVALCTREL